MDISFSPNILMRNVNKTERSTDAVTNALTPFRCFQCIYSICKYCFSPGNVSSVYYQYLCMLNRQSAYLDDYTYAATTTVLNETNIYSKSIYSENDLKQTFLITNY